jgi:hypothetical protein
MDDKKDIELLSDFVAGKPGSSDAFFKRYDPIILCAVGTIRIPSNSWSTKDDLFQEVRKHLCIKLRVIVGQWLKKHQVSFECYLFKICRRQAIKKLKGKEPTISDTSQNPDDNEEYCRNLHVESTFLLHVINSMPLRDQIFIRLDFFCKRPVDDLMKVFNMPTANSVYIKRNRVLQKLRTNARRIVRRKSTGRPPCPMPFEILEIEGIDNDTTISDIVDAWRRLKHEEREFLNNYYDFKADPTLTAGAGFALVNEKDLSRKKDEILKKLTEILKQRIKERDDENT